MINWRRVIIEELYEREIRMAKRKEVAVARRKTAVAKRRGAVATRRRNTTAASRLEQYCERALELGALDAKVVPTKTVVTAPWVRMRCQYGCAGYGRRLSCPPYSPTPEQTRQVVDCYKSAILLKGPLWEVNPIMIALEREIFLDGYYKAWSLGEGPCHKCDACALKAGCRFPQQLRPSMEASGIDVFQTVANNGYKLEVVRDYDCPAQYFGLVLVE
jgi:predicted metal-binding protein